MTRLFCLLFGISFLLLSCKKADSDYRTSGSPIAMIRGFEVRNEMGQKLENIGNPDIHLYSPSGDPSTFQLRFFSYPNPAQDIMEIIIGQRLNNITARFWIVPATFTGPGSESVVFLGPTIIAPAEKPLLDTVIEIKSSTRIIILRDFPEGFYRVYIKANGILLWDNIVFSKSFKYD
jgi:hypothetical protein